MIVLAALGMPWPLPYPFDREYMQLALVAAVALGMTAPLVGAFLVQKQLALLGDGIGHVALAGVGAGLWLNIAPLWIALIGAVCAALAIEWLRTRGRTPSDVALAVFFYGGIAAGVVLASRGGSTAALIPYLFGSILTVAPRDLWIVLGIALGIASTIAVAGRALLAVIIDPESSRVAGLPVNGLNAALAVLTATTVVAAMRIVGVLLIAALMVLPVATSRRYARSFRRTLITGAAIGGGAALGGLTLARLFGLAAGGTIVLLVTALFLFTSIVSALRSPHRASPHEH
ncbi:MAG: metal ABC transporter permease [Acidimicrobiia bacterium]